MRIPRFVPILVLTVALPMVLAAPAPAAGEDAKDFVAWHRRQALTLRAEGRLMESIEEWTALTAMTPGDASTATRAAVETVDAALTQNRIFQSEDPMYRLAEGLCLEAVRRGSHHDPSMSYVIGRMRTADKNWRQAFLELDFARRRGFDPVRADYWWFFAATNYGKWLVDENRPEEAIKILERAVREVPDHLHRLGALINLAGAHRAHSEHTIAEGVLRSDVLPVWPKAAQAWNLLGQIYADQARIDEALEMHRRAMDLAQESDDGVYTGPAVYAEALRHTANLELKAGRTDKAEALANQFGRLKPETNDAEYLRGRVLFQKFGETDERETLLEAVRCFRRAIRYDPEDQYSRAQLLEALPRLGPDFDAEKVAIENELRALQAKDRKTGATKQQ